jgi:hypothetical protein
VAVLTGGDKLKKYLEDLARQTSGGASLQVGFLEDATYPTGPRKNVAGKTVAPTDVNVATVAAAQEFGTSKIPPRPFFRNMINAKSASWGPGVALQLKKYNNNVGQALEATGLGIKGQLQQSIIDTNSPPLSPITIERKGFDKPLVDTSHMLNSVDYEVTVKS